jgi:hypothetical protein|tara:strand:+ start:2083 stop:2574 length:492 start_codon:yes stop_codon:yes gene_type:complete
MARLSTTNPELKVQVDKRIQKEPVRLSHIWKEKIALRQNSMDHRSRKMGAPENLYRVKWDDPTQPKGTNVTERQFPDMDSAMVYGVHIARTVDLRREGKDENSLDVRTGYNPVPDPSSMVMVVIETPFGLRELTEREVWPERQAGSGKYDKQITPNLDKIRGL